MWTRSIGAKSVRINCITEDHLTASARGAPDIVMVTVGMRSSVK
ncbi:unnamed protein product [Callosobruchus maculatus]|uniref:Uncharacterized protein n=1 Tax=Callosobruchus maculatus TaxID=64391 RepID=A0A653D1F2_CALMS|nr:unnamed protein product [Callosobruchus maculatus]